MRRVRHYQRLNIYQKTYTQEWLKAYLTGSTKARALIVPVNTILVINFSIPFAKLITNAFPLPLHVVS